MEWESIIGLEIHAELNTKTKLFCACENRFGGKANTRVCPVCTGVPGSLPVLNRAAVRAAIRTGVALGCKIRPKSQWARKHYAYPDLPKGYQISQHKTPLCYDGLVAFRVGNEEKTVRIRQINLEEDAGKLIHEKEETMIDYNRCGVPLIEIVTEPDLCSATEACALLEQIRLILLYLGVSDCRMQEGSLRCDVNVSLKEPGSETLGPRVEMKNINTFSGAERAIIFEIERQTKLLNQGGTVVQETRRWDDVKQTSTLLRSKENAEDYRFFPEPDLPMLVLQDQERKEDLPELPLARFYRYREAGIGETDATLMIASPQMAGLLDECLALGCVPRAAATVLLNLGEARLVLRAQQIYEVLQATEDGIISKTAARRVLEYLMEYDATVEQAITALNLRHVGEEPQLMEWVRATLSAYPNAVLDYRAGKKNAFGFLTGQCMRASKGRADPKRLQEILRSELDGYNQ